MMKLIITIIGVLAMLLGVWWMLQGTGVVPVGFMANNMFWAYCGAGLFVVALIVVVVVRRR